MGLLDSLFDPNTYGGQGGGLLDLLRTSQMQQSQYQPSAGFPQREQPASFADRFNAVPGAPQPFTSSGRSFDTATFDPQTYAPNQAQPIAVGSNYQMPRMGSADQYSPPQQSAAALPPNAQPTQGLLPQGAPMQAPMQQPMQPPQGPDFSDRMFAGLRSIGNPGGMINKLADAATAFQTGQVANPAAQQANQTATYLRSVGVPNEAIIAAVGNGRAPGNPEVLKTLLTKYANQEKVRPATPEERRQYGAPDSLPMSIDTTTNKPSYGPANTSISNVINGEKEQDKVIGKGYGERFNEIQKAGMTAPAALGTLNLMEKLISDPNFYSGTGGQAATTLKRLAVSAGIAGAETATPNELFQKLSQKSVLDAAGGSLGTGFSNADRDYLNGTVANLGNTPEGNKKIIEIGRQVQQRNVEIAKQARDYAKSHGGRLDSGFEDQVAEYAEKNPLFANAAPARPAAPSVAPDRAAIEAEMRRRGLMK